MKERDGGGAGSWSRLIRPERAWFWVLLAVLVRGGILLAFLGPAADRSPERVESGFVIIHDDYGYFLRPVDNYLETGTFEYKAGSGRPFAGRMPGYSLPYLATRLVFDRDAGIRVLILGQFLLSSFCVWVLARLAERLFGTAIAFYGTFALFSVSTFTAIFDPQTVSESFSVSATILALYFLIAAMERESKSAALTAGFFLAWSVFLRPFLGLLLLLFALYLLIGFVRSGRVRAGFGLAVVLALPFVLLESAWVVRNYRVLGRFVPLQTSVSESYGRTYSESWVAIRRLVVSWGGDASYWTKGSAAWWFRNAEEDQAEGYRFPAHVFENGGAFERRDLEDLRDLYRAFRATPEGSSEGERLDREIVIRAKALTDDYQERNRFRARFVRHLVAVRELVFNSGSEYLPLRSFGRLSLPWKSLKLFYSALYYVVVAGGAVGLLLAIRRGQKYAWLCLLIVVNLVLTITFVSPIPQSRYFVTAYPVLLLFAVDLFTRRLRAQEPTKIPESAPPV